MYSPKVREELIPKLWRLAKARRVPMTKLVNEFIEEALIGEDIPETVEEVQKRGARNGQGTEGGFRCR